MARGDQIYVIRPFLNMDGVYQHHGIDCGDGNVIHYRKKKEIIQRTSMTTFTQGRTVYLRTYQTCYISEVVIHRAETRLGEQQYNLLFNNCEHFASWCKTGVSRSQQVENFMPLISQIQVDSLYEPIRKSLQDPTQDKAKQLFNEALADIKIVWDDLQPRYNYAQQEINAWQQVALEALKKNREDLARGAIRKKLDYQEQAIALETQLKKLASLTENLISNIRDWQI